MVCDNLHAGLVLDLSVVIVLLKHDKCTEMTIIHTSSKCVLVGHAGWHSSKMLTESETIRLGLPSINYITM